MVRAVCNLEDQCTRGSGKAKSKRKSRRVRKRQRNGRYTSCRDCKRICVSQYICSHFTEQSMNRTVHKPYPCNVNGPTLSTPTSTMFAGSRIHSYQGSATALRKRAIERAKILHKNACIQPPTHKLNSLPVIGVCLLSHTSQPHTLLSQTAPYSSVHQPVMCRQTGRGSHSIILDTKCLSGSTSRLDRNCVELWLPY